MPRNVFHSRKYEMNVKYQEGNPMNEKILERTAITKSNNSFIN